MTGPRRSKPASPGRPTRLRRAAATLAAALGATAGLGAQAWTLGPYLQPGGDCPPFVFVTMPKARTAFGVDAQPDTRLAGRLELGDAGRQLWFMDRSLAEPRLLFPLPSHQAVVASGVPLERGSVHEPSVYHHHATGQYWVFFSFAADLVAPSLARPCNLYALNITAAVDDPAGFVPAALPVVKLDDAGSYTEQDLYERSLHPGLMPQDDYTHLLAWPGAHGVDAQFETSTGACVVEAEHGPMLFFASNARRADGEGMVAGELRFTHTSVELLSRNEVMHFGTTSLISFFPTPRGAGASYRSSTEATGQWNVFELRSDLAEWQTLSGYANQDNIADHNGTTIAIGPDPDDSVLAISRYYVGNNEGFGTIVLLPYETVGRNHDDGVEHIGQLGFFANDPDNTTNLFPAIPEFSDVAIPSGKFALPAAGRRATAPDDVELFLTYSAGPAHDGPVGRPYDASLVVVTDISQKILPVGGTYLPGTPGYPVQLVLKHESLHTFALQPILSGSERFGWRRRDVLPLPGPGAGGAVPPALADLPVARVTAGPIYDTDVRAMARRLGGYYDPTTESRNNGGTDRLAMRVSCLTKDVPSGWFADPAHQDEVWGLRVFVTDPMVRKLIHGGPTPAYAPDARWGYLHHDGGGDDPFGEPIPYERYRHLSDVPADADGMVDFYVPANVPLKFELLHRDGTVLAKHRNHHSFAPGQHERRCTGCHQHTDPMPGPATSTSQPLDLLTKTGRYGWDAAGNPTFQWLPQPTREVPEFRADIFPLLQAECASCHDRALDPNGSGLASGFDLQLTPPGSTDRALGVWLWLNRQRYVNRRLGAAKSPLVWHFTGLQSDHDVRLDGETNSRYKGTGSNGQLGPILDEKPSRYWITVAPGAANPHPGVADQRHTYKVIEWIDAGAAIDHGAVTPQGQPDPRRGVNGDGYQIALSARMQSYGSTQLRIGYWDVAANVATITVTVRGSSIAHTVLGQGNGAITHDLLLHNLPGGPPTPRDVLRVEAVDTAGNVSRLEKTLHQLLLESESHRGKVELSSNGRVFTAGQQLTLSVDARPSLANRFWFHVASDDLYPATLLPPQFGVYTLPAPGPWFDHSLSFGVLGQLDAAGKGSWTLQLPPVVVPAELYCVACVIAGPRLAKSNPIAFRTQ